MPACSTQMWPVATDVTQCGLCVCVLDTRVTCAKMDKPIEIRIHKNKVDLLHVRLTELHAAHQNLPFPPISASESWYKGSNIAFVWSPGPVVNEESMRTGHWLGLGFCVSLSVRTLTAG